MISEGLEMKLASTVEEKKKLLEENETLKASLKDSQTEVFAGLDQIFEMKNSHASSLNKLKCENEDNKVKAAGEVLAAQTDLEKIKARCDYLWQTISEKNLWAPQPVGAFDDVTSAPVKPCVKDPSCSPSASIPKPDPTQEKSKPDIAMPSFRFGPKPIETPKIEDYKPTEVKLFQDRPGEHSPEAPPKEQQSEGQASLLALKQSIAKNKKPFTLQGESLDEMKKRLLGKKGGAASEGEEKKDKSPTSSSPPPTDARSSASSLANSKGEITWFS